MISESFGSSIPPSLSQNPNPSNQLPSTQSSLPSLLSLPTFLSSTQPSQQLISDSPLTIVTIVVIVIIFFVISIYIYIIYCHPDEKDFNNNFLSYSCKGVIVLTQVISWIQLGVIMVDLTSSSNQSISSSNQNTLETIYSVIFVAIFILTTFLLPLLSAVYESDDVDDSLLKRLCESFLYTVVICGIWSAAVFISYVFIIQNQQQNDKMPIPFYMALCQGFVGWILLVINGSIGLIYLPYDFIIGFVHRPKKISKQEALELKQSIQVESDDLIEEGQKLIIIQQQFYQKSSSMNWFTKKRQTSRIKNLIKTYKSHVIELESHYELFNQQLHLSEQNPVIPFLWLFCGILAAIFSIIWFVQLFSMTIYISGEPIFPFLDTILHSLQQSDDLNFLSTIIYALLVIYLQICLIKGNTIFGIKIPYIISFHPLQPNKTYLNSLLFNVSLMALTSLSITQISLIVFPTYLQSTFLKSQYFLDETTFKSIDFFGPLYSDRIYTIVFLILLGLAMVYWIVKSCCCMKKNDTSKIDQQKGIPKRKESAKSLEMKNTNLSKKNKENDSNVKQ